jgi:hypothetical protein
MKSLLLSFALFFSSSSFAKGPAVLFEEVEVPSTPVYKSKPAKNNPTQEITPLSQRNSLRETYLSQEFDSTLDMRAKRRMGVGASVFGSTGLMGALLELNFVPENSLIASFGGGPGYGAFGFQWKHLFGGRKFSPYAGFGYARWYNASAEGKKIEKTTPNELGSKFLDDEEKKTGKFGVNLLVPNLGFQYSLLSGPWTGSSFFAEINFLTPFSNLSPVPVAGFGALYYF